MTERDSGWTQLVVPQGQRPLHANSLGGLHTGLVYRGVHRLPAQGIHVVVEHLLQMDQAALARAVAPVLQGGEGDGVIHHVNLDRQKSAGSRRSLGHRQNAIVMDQLSRVGEGRQDVVAGDVRVGFQQLLDAPAGGQPPHADQAKRLCNNSSRVKPRASATATKMAAKMPMRKGSCSGTVMWEEFDLEAAEWRIPAERMKMRTPHIVPPSSQALEVLATLHELRSGNGLLFPGERDHEKPISNNTILKALERMGYKHRMTGHGFRGIASTILHELSFRHDVIELQLAHQERNAISAAYNHATYLPERPAMMQAWADHLDALRRGAKVLPFKAA